MLVDAIHFLKINDKREREYFSKTRRKQPWTLMGAEAAAINSVYGIEELFGYFKQFSDFESILYGTDKYYRDHVTHPIKVWLIGQHILAKFGSTFSFSVGGKHIPVKDAKHADDSFEPPQDRVLDSLYISTAELSAMWAIIALTHDLGYPLEKVEKINDRLATMLNEFGKIGFSRSKFYVSDSTRSFSPCRSVNLISSTVCTEASPDSNGKKSKIQKWATRVRTKYHTKFSKSWEMFDHGIVSSLLLLKSLTFFIESDLSTDIRSKLSGEDARQFTVRSEILHAISLSHHPENIPPLREYPVLSIGIM